MNSERIIQLLVAHARPEILKEFRSDSCIASTRIGMDVLDYFGILSEPLPVQVMIWNPAFVQRIDAGNKFPQHKKELDSWVEEFGAWNIGLGMGGERGPNKWPGHLVLIGERKWLIDLSLEQANRPQHNINLASVRVEVGKEFLTGKEPAVVLLKSGCALRFIATPANLGYTVSLDWFFEKQRENVVKNIIAKIKQEF